jgi:hypothetical protein
MALASGGWSCIVTDHGFWQLGRFSVAYRTMFGERRRRSFDDRRISARFPSFAHRPSQQTLFRLFRLSDNTAATVAGLSFTSSVGMKTDLAKP